MSDASHGADMSTLMEVEAAVANLSTEELQQLERVVRQTMQRKSVERSHSIMDLRPSQLGEMLHPLGTREEWHGEMRED